MGRGEVGGRAGPPRPAPGPGPGRAVASFLRRHAPLLLASGALAALFMWRTWALNPADRLAIGGADDDFLRQFYPYRAFVAGALAAARLPLWNPHQYAGTPALADPQMAVLYPWRLLQAPLALGGRTLPVWSVTLEAIAHLALGAWFAGGLARSLGAGAAGAALAAVVFGFGGYLTGYPLQQLAVLDSAVWIPASLWGLSAAVHARTRRSRRAAVAGAGAATALALLAGHPQTAAYCIVAGGALLALWAVRGAPGSASALVSGSAPAPALELAPGATAPGAGVAGHRAAIARIAAVWAVLAAGLSAAQWLPTAGLARHAAREISRAEVLAGLPVGDVAQLVAPYALSCWSPLYVGAVPLALALWGTWREPRARPWLGLAAAGWLAALGGNGPLMPAVFALAPWLGVFRHQERAAVLVSLGLAVAAGLALERARRSPSSASAAARASAGLALAALLAATWFALSPTAAGAATAAACRLGEDAGPLRLALADGLAATALYAGLGAAALAWLARSRAAGGSGLGAALVLVAVVALDLFGANRGRALAPIEAAPHAPDAILDTLLPRARDGRVSSEGLLPGGPNAASVHGLFDVTGDSPLHLAPVAELVDAAPEIAWWRLLGVRYTVSERPIGPAEAELLAPLARGGSRTLYEVRLPAPQAWAHTRVEKIPAGWLPGPDFDPLAGVLLGPAGGAQLDGERAGEGTAAGASAGSTEDAGVAAATARLTALEPGRAVVEADLPAPGAVVLSSAWDPGGGWTARARGPAGMRLRPDVRPAYGTLLAVELPAGEWTVEWTYRPRAVILGGALSLVALVAMLYLLGVTGWRAQPRPGP